MIASLDDHFPLLLLTPALLLLLLHLLFSYLFDEFPLHRQRLVRLNSLLARHYRLTCIKHSLLIDSQFIALNLSRLPRPKLNPHLLVSTLRGARG